MEKYKNSGGNSNVTHYEIGSGFIRVRFFDGSIYKYTNSSVGHQNISDMKRLARCGMGLNAFINKNVRNKYVK